MTSRTADADQGLSPARPLRSRIAATFTAPAELAEALRERPRWIDVLLISTVVAVVAAALMPAEYFLAAAEDAVTRRGAPVEITSSPEEIVRWGRYIAMLNAAVGHPLTAFALAGVLSLVFTMLPRGRNTFAEHLALTSHALLIVALGTVLAIALRLGTGDPAAEVSLAALVPFVPRSSTPGEILSLINPFTVWMLVTVAIGISALDPARSRRSSLAVLLGGYLALVLTIGLAF